MGKGLKDYSEVANELMTGKIKNKNQADNLIRRALIFNVPLSFVYRDGFKKDHVSYRTYDYYVLFVDERLELDFQELVDISRDTKNSIISELTEIRKQIELITKFFRTALYLSDQYKEIKLTVEDNLTMTSILHALTVEHSYIVNNIKYLNNSHYPNDQLIEKRLETITYSVKEAAQILGVSASFLYKAVERNEIEYRKIGSKVLFSRETILNGGKHNAEV